MRNNAMLLIVDPAYCDRDKVSTILIDYITPSEINNGIRLAKPFLSMRWPLEAAINRYFMVFHSYTWQPIYGKWTIHSAEAIDKGQMKITATFKADQNECVDIKVMFTAADDERQVDLLVWNQSEAVANAQSRYNPEFPPILATSVSYHLPATIDTIVRVHPGDRSGYQYDLNSALTVQTKEWNAVAGSWYIKTDGVDRLEEGTMIPITAVFNPHDRKSYVPFEMNMTLYITRQAKYTL